MTRRDFLVRIYCVGIIVLFGFVFLSWQFYKLQIVEHETYSAMAKKLYTKTIRQSGRRGRIFDSTVVPKPNLLALSEPCFDIKGLPRLMGVKGNEDLHKEANIGHLIRILGRKVKESDLRRRFYSKKKEVTIASGVNLDTVDTLQKLGLPGVRFIRTTRRLTPKGALAANIIGFLDSKGQGAVGIEKVYNTELSPTDGEIIVERTRRDDTLATGRHDIKSQVENGHDVYLTINEPIQSIVEEELYNMTQEFPCKSAFAMMVNPKTGAVMALAQYPTFNPNDRSSFKPENYRNRMFEEVFDPGSTMKAVSLATVLEYNKNVNLDTRVFCEKGMWWYGGHSLRDAGHRYENLSFSEVIQKSSNIGTAKFALSVGSAKMHQGISRFGFGRKTGLDLGVKESPGIFHHWKKWSKVSITRVPMGQGISVTVPQMVQAYCALANGGKLMQLRIVDKLVGPNGVSIECPPQVKRQAVSPAVAAKIVEALKLVTKEGGTATKASVKGYDVAGKTGTSQKVIPAVRDDEGVIIQKSHYSNSKFIASFIGFVPADDPEFVLYIVSDEPPKRTHYGGTVAGPTFSRIAQKTLQYLSIPPTEIEEQ